MRYYVPATIDFLAEKIWQHMEPALAEDGYSELEPVKDKPFIKKVRHFDSFNFMDITNRVADDLRKVQFDGENVYCTQDSQLVGFHEFDGLAFLGVEAGGDWEKPVLFIIYWDGKELRAYIPTDGNPWNTDRKEAYGNDHESDNENAKKRFGVDNYDDAKRDVKVMLADIKAHIVLSPKCNGNVSGTKSTTTAPVTAPADVLVAVDKILGGRPLAAYSIVNQHATTGIICTAQQTVDDLVIALKERDEALAQLEQLRGCLVKIAHAVSDVSHLVVDEEE